jgi:hypothetical protein
VNDPTLSNYTGPFKNPPRVGDEYLIDWTWHTDEYLDQSEFTLINPYDPDEPNTHPHATGFSNGQKVEVLHTGGCYAEPGFYFYMLPGTGVFLDVGKTLVCHNKLAALRHLGMSEMEIAALFFKPSAEDAMRSYYWPAMYRKKGEKPEGWPGMDDAYLREWSEGEPLFTLDHLVDYYMEQHSIEDRKRATLSVLSKAIDGDDYNCNRLAATGWQIDIELYRRGRVRELDTIQFTTQPNRGNSWAFEIVDLRMAWKPDLSARDAEAQWLSHQRYLSVRDPFEIEEHVACTYNVPFKYLYCDGTRSAKGGV